MEVYLKCSLRSDLLSQRCFPSDPLPFFAFLLFSFEFVLKVRNCRFDPLMEDLRSLLVGLLSQGVSGLVILKSWDCLSFKGPRMEVFGYGRATVTVTLLAVVRVATSLGDITVSLCKAYIALLLILYNTSAESQTPISKNIMLVQRERLL